MGDYEPGDLSSLPSRDMPVVDRTNEMLIYAHLTVAGGPDPG